MRSDRESFETSNWLRMGYHGDGDIDRDIIVAVGALTRQCRTIVEPMKSMTKPEKICAILRRLQCIQTDLDTCPELFIWRSGFTWVGAFSIWVSRFVFVLVLHWHLFSLQNCQLQLMRTRHFLDTARSNSTFFNSVYQNLF